MKREVYAAWAYEWAAGRDDVQVLLSVRDSAEKWVASWEFIAPVIDALQAPPFRWSATMQALMPLMEELHKEAPTGGRRARYLDPGALREGYELHNAAVRRAVPPERLLEFNVKQGWGPLCAFLGVPEPPGPFPWVTDRVKVAGTLYTVQAVTWVWPVFIALPLALVAVCARRFRRKEKAA